MSVPLSQASKQTTEQVWTVSQLTAQIKELLEGEFPSVWVVGEISKLTQHASGHVYLTLKDDGAVIAAKIWRNLASRIVFDLKVGLEVIVRGRLDVWAPRGEYSLVIEQIQPKGLGALELAFRQLYERLQKEGLFAPAHKKPLPKFPRRVVLVTSPTGAAVRDMLQVLGRRWRNLEIWIRPVRVQGEGAASDVAAAIVEVNRLKNVDLMIIGRGGGSAEDLWAFNDEQLARTIFSSRIPIVSAIGHEVDWTIADHVADLRAPTPSAAAELVVPNEQEVRQQLTKDAARLARALQTRLRGAKQSVAKLAERRPFQFPFDAIFRRHQRCDELSDRLNRAAWNRLRDAKHRRERLAAMLEGLSPLSVLARGYSLTTREIDHTIVRNADEVVPGDRIVTRLTRGRLASRVEQSQANEGP